MSSLTASLGPHTVRRVGFDAMQLPGQGVMGPPRDHDEAVAVVRRAREHGVDHIDTASFYGPDVANQLLREALDPWPADLKIVSKVGARRDEDGRWLRALAPDEVRAAVARDLETLGIDRLTAVNLRVLDTPDEALLDALEALIGLRDERAIELIGLSNVDVRQLDLASENADIACVQTSTACSTAGARRCSRSRASGAWPSFRTSRSARPSVPLRARPSTPRCSASRASWRQRRRRLRWPGCCTTPSTCC